MKQHVIKFLELLKLNPVVIIGALEMCCTHRVVLHMFLFPEADSHPSTRKVKEEGGGCMLASPDDALQWVSNHL